ncbi:MAG: competence type IV pilus ATPase ComGA [Lactovum sp.]
MKDIASSILKSAIEFKANDIYFLEETGEYQLYFRNSVERKWIKKIELKEANSLISHFKFISGMNVGEKRRTQLGSVLYSFGQQSRRLRLSTVGDFQGQESLVIRILHEKTESLEFWFDELESLKKVIGQRGLYLFSGPVGSGKTSLMYHIAKEKFKDKQVISIEDPVEIVDEKFLQLVRNDVIGNSYDDLIKLSLRHMPDLVIVGEIRDEQTARAVIRASLTGYTVFSTIHAKSISGVWARLLELGIRETELENALNAVIYQRLLAGKGLIDYAKESIKTHSNSSWNEKIEILFKQRVLSSSSMEGEKISDWKTD